MMTNVQYEHRYLCEHQEHRLCVISFVGNLTFSLFRTLCSWCHQPRILLAVRRVARGNPPAWLSVAFTAQTHSESLLFLVITHYHSFDVCILTHSLIMYIQCRNSFAIYFSSTCKSIIVGAFGVTNSMCYSRERSTTEKHMVVNA